jgi:hypothetical protein
LTFLSVVPIDSKEPQRHQHHLRHVIHSLVPGLSVVRPSLSLLGALWLHPRLLCILRLSQLLLSGPRLRQLPLYGQHLRLPLLWNLNRPREHPQLKQQRNSDAL